MKVLDNVRLNVSEGKSRDMRGKAGWFGYQSSILGWFGLVLNTCMYRKVLCVKLWFRG